MAAAADLVLVEQKKNGLATITLNDPDARNAMGVEMGQRFLEVVETLRKKSDLRAVVLTGAGKAFSGGGHLEMLFEKTKLGDGENRVLMELFYNQFLSIRNLEVPVIAALNGHAVGAGLCLALGCDIRIAHEKAKLGLNFVKLGLHPGMGVTHFLPRLVGPGVASELLLTGRIIDAAEGYRVGLISRVCSDAEFSTVVEQTCEELLESGPLALRQLKESLRRSPFLPLEDALRREAECQAENYASAEFLEGISAAREKRKPKF